MISFSRLGKLTLLGMTLTFPSATNAQLIYSTNNGMITITGYNGSQAKVVIPASINDLPVNAIGDAAFANNQTLVEVEIPSGLDSIGISAFNSCPLLQTVTLPGTLQSIGNSAFAGCTSLSQIAVPSGITVIEAGTFAHTGLTGITLPSGITYIGNEAFYGCLELQVIHVPSGVANIGTAAFYGCSALEEVTLPAGLQFMGNGVFTRCFQLSTVTIPHGITQIGAEAFALCTNLARVVIPASVTNIGDYAFTAGDQLSAVFFLGHPPVPGFRLYYNSSQVVSYYLASSSGWGATFADRPTALWNPQLQPGGVNYGGGTNGFGFGVTGPPSLPIVIEAATNIASGWNSLQSCTLTNGSIYFNDPDSINHPSRFYRIRSP